MGASFALRYRFDSIFWPIFVILAWSLVFIGFQGQIRLRFTGAADYEAPLALIVHVYSFFGWFTLLTLQLVLSRMKRVDLHRLTGWGALLLIPAMAWSAIAAEIYGQRFYFPEHPEVVRFFPIPVFSMIAFVLAAGAAVWLRKRRATHMRLIYLATSIILVATFFRWWGDAISTALPESFWTKWAANFIGANLLFVAGAAYDLLTRGRIHPVFLIAAPVLIAGQLAAVGIGESDWWPAVGRSLLGL